MKSLAIFVLALVAVNGVIAMKGALRYLNTLESFIERLDSRDDRDYGTRFVKLTGRIEADVARGMDYTEAFHKELSESVNDWYTPKVWRTGSEDAYKKAIDRPCKLMRKAEKEIGFDKQLEKCLKVCDLYKSLGPSSVKRPAKELDDNFNTQRYGDKRRLARRY